MNRKVVGNNKWQEHSRLWSGIMNIHFWPTNVITGTWQVIKKESNRQWRGFFFFLRDNMTKWKSCARIMNTVQVHWEGDEVTEKWWIVVGTKEARTNAFNLHCYWQYYSAH